jgi:hypothetical protein
VVELTIEDHLPEWIPMFGRKVRIYYHGMRKQCNNCYDLDHLKKDCTAPRLNWMGYVEKLRKTGKYEDQMFGSWLDEPRTTEPTADLRNYLDDPENLKKAVASFLDRNNKKKSGQQNGNDGTRNPQRDRSQSSYRNNGQNRDRNNGQNRDNGRKDTRDLRSHLDRNRNQDQSQDRYDRYRWRNPNMNQDRRDNGYNGNNPKRGRRT